MNAVSNGVAKIEKYLAIALIFSVTVILALAVLFRYFLNSPLSWAGEVSIFLLVWISFVGGSLGLKYKTQASLTFILDMLPEKAQKIVLIVGHVLMIIFMLIVLYYAYTWVFSPTVASQLSNTARIPLWIPYSAVPFGLTFATIHILGNLTNIIRGGDGE